MENLNQTNALSAEEQTNALVTHDATNEPESRTVAERLAAEIAAVPDEETIQVNLEVANAVTLVLGLWPKLETYLPEIAELPKLDVASIRKVREYTLALHHWQSRTLYAAAPPPGLAIMAERGAAIRERTVKDLESLAGHGLIEASALANFGGTTGYRKVALDLSGISSFVHANWERIRGKSAITLEAMDDAAKLGDAIMQSVGDRERSPTVTAEAARLRDKAFTLFLRAYDEARRAVQYLRWHEEDADTIAPSLYSVKRSGKKRSDEAVATEAVAAPVPVSSVAAPAEPASSPLLVMAPSGPFAPR